MVEFINCSFAVLLVFVVVAPTVFMPRLTIDLQLLLLLLPLDQTLDLRVAVVLIFVDLFLVDFLVVRVL